MGRLGTVVREVRLADVPGRRADGRDPGFPVARAPPLRDLCARRPRHPHREGPREPCRRYSGMGADRRHLCAGFSRGGPGRRPRKNPLAAGRRQRTRTRGEGGAQAADRYPLSAATRHQPLRHARERRDRCGDLRARAGNICARRSARPALSEPSRRRGALLQEDRDLPDLISSPSGGRRSSSIRGSR